MSHLLRRRAAAPLLGLLLALPWACSARAQDDSRKPTGWALTSARNCPDTGEQISRPDYTPRGWMPAVVPGTVLTSYVRNGRYPEPYSDVNNKVSKGLIPDAGAPGTVFAVPHWYRAMFTLTPSDVERTLWLHLDGINYRADLFLNGRPLGKMAGMFKRGLFNVTGLARPGRNALAVEVSPLDTPGQVHDSGCGGDRHIGKTAATMYAAVGWDFTIVDGIRDRNIGIYRDVYLTETGPVLLRDPFMVTKTLPRLGTDTADLSFQTTLTNATDRPVGGRLEVAVEGGPVVTQPVTLAPLETRAVTLDSGAHPGLVIPRPRLWWPVGSGKASLYGLRVSFVTTGGDVSDTLRTHFGIRTVTQDTSFHGQNTFFVNGRRTFIQGGNWVQDAMLRATRRGYEAKLRQVAQAGVNMLRCWSASAPESDDFYDTCDRLGLMVWTESGAAAQVDGPEDRQLQLDNWADTVLRVRNHPSQSYYCGGNEGWPVAGTREVTLQNDPTHGYQDSSQENGQRGCPYRYLGINTLYDYTAKDLFGSGPLGPFAGFCNETGNPALPPAEVLRGFLPARKLWPTTDNPAFDEAIDYHDGGGFHQVRRLINEGCAAFGPFDRPDPAGRIGLENYAFKGQILGAMQYRAFSEVWKRNKWDEANKRYDTGYMLWTINNANPMAASRLASYSGEPNAALFYFAHGNKPLHAQYDYFYNDVSVVNDRAIPYKCLTVTAEVRNLDWSLKWRESRAVSVGQDQPLLGVLSVPAKDAPGFGAVHFILVTLRDAGGALLDRALYWRSRTGPKYGADGPWTALNGMPMARLRVASSVHQAGGRQTVTVTLTNPTARLAFFTRLKVYHARSQALVQPTEYSDDYFSLLPQEKKTVTLNYDTPDLNGERPQLIVEGWNIHPLALRLSSSGMTSSAPSLYRQPVRQAAPESAVPLSQDRPATASSTEPTGNVASNAVDGDGSTRWASQLGHDPEWLMVDLGTSKTIQEVRLNWEAACGRDYEIQVSDDAQHWTAIKSVTSNAAPGIKDYAKLNGYGRYVRLYGTARATQYGYSLYEFQVYGH